MLINQSVLSDIYTSFNTIFNMQLEQTKTFWESVATRVPSTTRSNDYKWLGAMPALREWIGERQIKNLSGYKYEISNKSFEATVSLDRDDIEDDNIGVYKPVIQQLAQNAKQHPDILIFSLLKNGFTNKCFDGKAFFSDSHKIGSKTYSNYQSGSANSWFLLDTSKPVKPLIMQFRRNPEFVALDRIDDSNVFKHKEYLYGVDYRGNAGYGFWMQAFGSKAALDADSFKAARQSMETIKNEEGTPLAITPNLLVVGPSNRDAAETLLNSKQISGSTNTLYKAVDLLVVPYLD